MLLDIKCAFLNVIRESPRSMILRLMILSERELLAIFTLFLVMTCTGYVVLAAGSAARAHVITALRELPSVVNFCLTSHLDELVSQQAFTLLQVCAHSL